jgi:1-acyl-sn-glycerol-3-phosphate acyltransferase
MPGAGVLAREMDVPVVPVAITGMHELLPYPRFVIPKKLGGPVRVAFGEPLWLADEPTNESAAAALRRAVEALAYRPAASLAASGSSK